MTVKDILNMSFPIEFGTDEDGEDTYAIEDVYNQLDGTVETAYGASKFIIFLNDDEVVKVPFNGCYWYDPDAEGGWRFDEFYYSKDYCGIEASVYADAVALGMEKFFASTKYYGRTVEGTPIYLSERVYAFYENDDARHKTKSSEDSNKKASEINKKYNKYINAEWLAKAVEFYGEDAVIDLMAFIDLEHIDDFHTGNVGFRKDGSPVILDYSGYKEN